MIYCSAKGERVPEREIRASDLAVIWAARSRGRLAMGWSMDRQGIRTSFDGESRRLKQIELSGSRRERVSLATYPDDLSAREAEVCQDAKYGQWREPTAAPAAGRPFERVETQVRRRQSNGRREGCENI